MYQIKEDELNKICQYLDEILASSEDILRDQSLRNSNPLWWKVADISNASGTALIVLKSIIKDAQQIDSIS